ncbi:protein of unknown function [Candidatus Filomicrobium marinum]|uniref:Uncharacterized protein n=1 Tax=Candidatus Filomicrobium marinum TaxID=1608628 RepID=A0A0D6JB14_9HYPH|nr:protein of unknown function [Candidatus Filomicrobium marinum]CPR16035.1 protein of unknown function [Candidatus Filomicrobium marinum]
MRADVVPLLRSPVRTFFPSDVRPLFTTCVLAFGRSSVGPFVTFPKLSAISGAFVRSDVVYIARCYVRQFVRSLYANPPPKHLDS